MTGSTILDVMIAMAVFYFAMSAFCAAVNEAVARFFGWRAGNMERMLRSLFLNALDEDGVPIMKKFTDHGLIRTLVLQAEARNSGWVQWARSWVGPILSPFSRAIRAFFTPAVPPPGANGSSGSQPQPLIASAQTQSGAIADQIFPESALESIPTSVFVRVIPDIIRPKGDNWKPSGPIDFDRYRLMVKEMASKNDSKLWEALASLADDPNKSMEALRDNLGAWFESVVSQSSSWYEATMRRTSVLVAIVLAVCMNIDSLAIADRFYRDSTLRMVMVSQGTNAAKIDINDPKAVVRSMNDILKELNRRPGVPVEKSKDASKDPMSQVDDANVVAPKIADARAAAAKEALVMPDVGTFHLPMGWNVSLEQDWETNWNNIRAELSMQKHLGLLISIVALSMGAPYWHDLLKRLVSTKEKLATENES